MLCPNASHNESETSRARMMNEASNNTQPPYTWLMNNENEHIIHIYVVWYCLKMCNQQNTHKTINNNNKM